jgi:hypothetical protein
MSANMHPLFESDDKPRCPECGMDLTHANIKGHINDHWGERWERTVENPDALERIHILLKMAEKVGH